MREEIASEDLKLVVDAALDPDSPDRGTAIAVLQEIGDPAIKLLTRRLRSDKHRIQACAVLIQFGAPAVEPLFNAIVRWKGEGKPAAYAREAIGRIGAPAVPYVLDQITERNKAPYAVVVLAQIGNPAIAPLVRACRAAKDYDYTFRVATTLSYIETPEAVSALKTLRKVMPIKHGRDAWLTVERIDELQKKVDRQRGEGIQASPAAERSEGKRHWWHRPSEKVIEATRARANRPGSELSADRETPPRPNHLRPCDQDADESDRRGGQRSWFGRVFRNPRKKGADAGEQQRTHTTGCAIKFISTDGEADTLDRVRRFVADTRAGRVFVIGGLTYLTKLAAPDFPGYQVFVNRNGTFGWLLSICDYLRRTASPAVLVTQFPRQWEKPQITLQINDGLGVLLEPYDAAGGHIETASAPPGMTLRATPASMDVAFCFVTMATPSYFAEVLRSQGCPPRQPTASLVIVDLACEGDIDTALIKAVRAASDPAAKEKCLRDFAHAEETRRRSQEHGTLRRTFTGGIMLPGFHSGDVFPPGALTCREIAVRKS